MTEIVDLNLLSTDAFLRTLIQRLESHDGWENATKVLTEKIQVIMNRLVIYFFMRVNGVASRPVNQPEGGWSGLGCDVFARAASAGSAGSGAKWST